MNIMERVAILSTGGPVGEVEVTQLLPATTTSTGAIPPYQEGDSRPLRERLEDYERSLIEGALGGARGNIAEAGRRLQTDRANLYRRMTRLGIRDGDEGETGES